MTRHSGGCTGTRFWHSWRVPVLTWCASDLCVRALAIVFSSSFSASPVSMATLTYTASQANAVHFVRIAGNPTDRCAHQCGLDHTAVVLSAVIIAMFIAFQLAWTCAIVSACAPPHILLSPLLITISSRPFCLCHSANMQRGCCLLAAYGTELNPGCVTLQCGPSSASAGDLRIGSA